jgi:hypothetical protein
MHHERMAGGDHGLPKVSLGPAMPYPSTSCGWATPETALRPFQPHGRFSFTAVSTSRPFQLYGRFNLTAVDGVARLQGWRPVAVLYPFVYAYVMHGYANNDLKD